HRRHRGGLRRSGHADRHGPACNRHDRSEKHKAVAETWDTTMRHNFVNDIGDYSKYALLRALCGHGSGIARLGVLWYLTEHRATNGDGRKRPHLSGDGWDAL